MSSRARACTSANQSSKERVTRAPVLCWSPLLCWGPLLCWSPLLCWAPILGCNLMLILAAGLSGGCGQPAGNPPGLVGSGGTPQSSSGSVGEVAAPPDGLASEAAGHVEGNLEDQGRGAAGSDLPLAGGVRPDGGLGGASGVGSESAATAAGAGGGAAGSMAASSAGETAAGDNCNLPQTVSFKTDVQPFLIASCAGNGCHVIDATSTVGSGGYNHAYDWATAGAHSSSCPGGPLRFEVLIAVIEAANPPTCSRSRVMPPPDASGAGQRAPLTRCQVATLQAWLDEPRVTQMHRADDSSPTTPYSMPPFN